MGTERNITIGATPASAAPRTHAHESVELPPVPASLDEVHAAFLRFFAKCAQRAPLRAPDRVPLRTAGGEAVASLIRFAGEGGIEGPIRLTLTRLDHVVDLEIEAPGPASAQPFVGSAAVVVAAAVGEPVAARVGDRNRWTWRRKTGFEPNEDG